MKWLVGFCLAVALSISGSLAASHGTPWANTGSPLGTNLAGITNGSAEQPFLNIFKTGTGWSTGTTIAEIIGLYQNCLDGNGYVTAIPCANPLGGNYTFTFVDTRFFINVNGDGIANDNSGYTYPAGNYLFEFDGQGTFNTNTVALDATMSPSSCSTSPCVLTVTSPSASGFYIFQSATGSGANHATNFRLVYCGIYSASAYLPSLCSTGYDTLLAGGETFNPAFISAIKPFKTLRFMDWMATTSNFQTNWSDRHIPGWVFYADSPTNATINGADPRSDQNGINDGVPAEVMFSLCNEINADCWFSMPPLATSAYITNFATLAHSNLNGNIKVYVEYGNEVWAGNFASQQSGSIGGAPLNNNNVLTQMAHAGWALFPNLNGNVQQGAIDYGAYMAIQSGTLWKSAWGSDSGRVTSLWGGQNGNAGLATFWLALKSTNNGGPSTWGAGTPNPTGTLGQNVDALAIAPYFNYLTPDAWTADADDGLNKLFQEISPIIVGASATLIPTALDTGNCGNGAGLTCGGTTAYTFQTAQTISCPPANGTMIAFQMNATNAANATLAVTDGTHSCSAAPLQQNNGSSSGTARGAGTLVSGNQYVAAYTSSVNGGAVSTPGWRVFLGSTFGFAGTGMLGETINGLQANVSTATSYSLRLLGYEWGQQLTAGEGAGNDVLLQSQYVSANRDPRMYIAYEALMTAWKANGGQAFNHYFDIGAYQTSGLWGSLENVLQPISPQSTSPKRKAQTDFINQNPCWWSGCR